MRCKFANAKPFKQFIKAHIASLRENKIEQITQSVEQKFTQRLAITEVEHEEMKVRLEQERQARFQAEAAKEESDRVAAVESLRARVKDNIMMSAVMRKHIDVRKIVVEDEEMGAEEERQFINAFGDKENDKLKRQSQLKRQKRIERDKLIQRQIVEAAWTKATTTSRDTTKAHLTKLKEDLYTARHRRHERSVGVRQGVHRSERTFN